MMRGKTFIRPFDNGNQIGIKNFLLFIFWLFCRWSTRWWWPCTLGWCWLTSTDTNSRRPRLPRRRRPGPGLLRLRPGLGLPACQKGPRPIYNAGTGPFPYIGRSRPLNCKGLGPGLPPTAGAQRPGPHWPKSWHHWHFFYNLEDRIVQNIHF